ncbi:hypothetical protein TNCT_308191 [Trichonephila clavata]|uniref:Uncharacterized protein n=1 Tax=Trichonephila clavata TaxID=2740835 RepID=A0A8X6KZK8_TRICU|nr:hypothetical protein TNCT_308191 [Trichonephila clavata]
MEWGGGPPRDEQLLSGVMCSCVVIMGIDHFRGDRAVPKSAEDNELLGYFGKGSTKEVSNVNAEYGFDSRFQTECSIPPSKTTK